MDKKICALCLSMMYAETAYQPGGATAEDVDGVLNEQTSGLGVAYSSLLATQGGALPAVSATKLQSYKSYKISVLCWGDIKVKNLTPG